MTQQPHPVQQYAPPAPRPTSGAAVGGFVLSLLWLGGFGTLLGLLLCFVALSEINRTGKGGRGLAVAGLVIGLLSIVPTVIMWSAIIQSV